MLKILLSNLPATSSSEDTCFGNLESLNYILSLTSVECFSESVILRLI